MEEYQKKKKEKKIYKGIQSKLERIMKNKKGWRKYYDFPLGTHIHTKYEIIGLEPFRGHMAQIYKRGYDQREKVCAYTFLTFILYQNRIFYYIKFYRR